MGTIRSGIAPTDDAAARKIDRPKRLGDRLARLMETILDVSRIATGKLHLDLERLALVAVVRESIEGLGDEAAHADCLVTVDAAGAIEGEWDRVGIERVLTNVMSNAIKYAAGKAIDVSVAIPRCSAVQSSA